MHILHDSIDFEIFSMSNLLLLFGLRTGLFRPRWNSAAQPILLRHLWLQAATPEHFRQMNIQYKYLWIPLHLTWFEFIKKRIMSKISRKCSENFKLAGLFQHFPSWCSLVLISGSNLFSSEIIHQYINTYLKFISGLYHHIAFRQPWNSAGNAKHYCLIDEPWTVCVSLPLFPVSTSAITAVHRKISCCVWGKSDWQQAANSQTAAEIWFTEINKLCLCCCNVLCSTLSESDSLTDWLAEWMADREADWMTI